MALSLVGRQELPPDEGTASFNESVTEEATRRQQPQKVVQKERFALLVARGTRPEEAGRLVDISTATAYRWLQEKSVKEAVAKVKGEVQAAGQRKLQRLQHEAIETVAIVMRTAKFDSDKLKAAQIIIDRTGLSVAELTADSAQQAPIVNIIKNVNMALDNPADAQQRRARMQEEMYAKQATIIEATGRTVADFDTADLEGEDYAAE